MAVGAFGATAQAVPVPGAGWNHVKILVVDDNPADRYACRRCLERLSWGVVEAETPEGALAALESQEFQVILSDFNLRSTMDGIDVLAHALAVRPTAHRILMSGFAMAHEVDRARKQASVDGFIEKPDTPTGWAQALERALTEASARRA